ncbi:hypothetical protein Pmani_031677 [Petrolisthes manimaculis]|uniref:Uncharacterized protein n=1 Tax=Petrolisthes manimaculis TaxID=1843537 RepID=A0AAE1TUK5_9EUCA|nr:hypothetical protein Pmani_031677 [Petrolisthes manimaculis]
MRNEGVFEGEGCVKVRGVKRVRYGGEEGEEGEVKVGVFEDAVNRVLSYPGWRPLLVSPLACTDTSFVQKWWASVQYVPLYFNYLGKLFESLGVTFISGLAALILTLLVELPVRSSLDLIIPSPVDNRTSGQMNQWTNEPVDNRTSGQMNQWTIEPVDN